MHNKKLIRFSSKIELNELVTKGNLMSSHHFTLDERESILIYHMQGLNFSQIAKLLHHHPLLGENHYNGSIQSLL